MSYSGYKSSPRGSRGGYRGGGYRGSRGGDGGGWRGSSRGYAGSSRGSGRGGRFSSSGGGGKWDRDDSSSYDSRSRYSGGGGERYSSHSRDDGSYRSYRGDDSVSFSSRDHSHRGGSPDRKRMRTEYSPASSMHRSHDYDGLEYSSRSYGSYEGKRISGYGGGDDRRVSSFREERERIRSDDYQFRKPLSIGGPRHSTPRGSPYRGRSSFARGLRTLRSSFRRYEPARGEPFLRKRTAVGNYGIRKPIGRTQEYLRRLKLYRIQRLRRLRERVEKEGSGDDDEEEEEIEEEEEVEEEVTDEDIEGEEKEDDEKAKKDTENDEDEELEASGEEKKDDDKKKKKVKKMVKVIKKIKRKIPKKKDDEKDKDESGENKDIQVTVKQDSEGRDVTPVRKNYLGQPFIKLECPHCHTNCETFKDYMLHLHKSKHKIAMGAVTTRVSKALAKLRMEQRTEQKDIDEEAKLKNMNMRTFFCLTCKLNYRSLKSEHLRSEKHKEIKNFLGPYCKICRVTCKSPMQYENHVCSLFHLKRKYFYDKKNAENVDGSEIDMDKFMVLDQVGSGEDDDDETESDEKEEGEENETEKGEKEGEEEAGEEGAEKTKEKKVKKKKKQINLGSEYCKKINIYFCELCKTFLPRIEDQEQALAVHCRGSLHLRWYVRKKDDLALRKKAERIHRLREAQKKTEVKEVDKSEPNDDTTEVKVKIEPEAKKDTRPENMDDKVWGEVNADLGELLKGVDEPRKVDNVDSDDDEDSRAAGRRYDRFKHSEKAKAAAGGEGEKKSTEEKGAKAGVVNGGEDKDA